MLLQHHLYTTLYAFARVYFGKGFVKICQAGGLIRYERRSTEIGPNTSFLRNLPKHQPLNRFPQFLCSTDHRDVVVYPCNLCFVDKSQEGDPNPVTILSLKEKLFKIFFKYEIKKLNCDNLNLFFFKSYKI